MSWLKAIEILFKLKDIKDTVDEAKKLSDYAQKLDKMDPAKVKWDNLKYFDNKTMDAATAQLRKTEDKLDAILSDKLEWPASGGMSAFLEAMKATDKFGVGSKETKKALTKYKLVLMQYQLALVSIVSDLKDANKEMPKRIQAAGALASYSTTLEGLFLKLAKIPSLTGTAQNAMFFSLSVDAGQLSGIAGSVETKLKTLESRNDAYIKEGNDLVKQNKLWIDWAMNDATKSDDAIKKNQRNEKPK